MTHKDFLAKTNREKNISERKKKLGFPVVNLLDFP